MPADDEENQQPVQDGDQDGEDGVYIHHGEILVDCAPFLPAHAGKRTIAAAEKGPKRMELDREAILKWVGRRWRARDVITPRQVAGLIAILDDRSATPEVGEPVPPGGHWLFFPVIRPGPDLGPDGHPDPAALGEESPLPPVPLARRMWAGGSIEFPGVLRVGDDAEKTTEITDIAFKDGRGGPLVFVIYRNVISGPAGPAVIETQDVVLRAPAAAGETPPVLEPAPADAAWSRAVVADPVMLFRYSALMFNGHRIHYDRDYAVNEEGYPGLVVHGPLTATLLMDLVRREMPEARMESFTYRARSPLYDGESFAIAGKPSVDGKKALLWAAGPGGGLAFSAEAGFKSS